MEYCSQSASLHFAEHLKSRYSRLAREHVSLPGILFLTATFDWKSTRFQSIEELRPGYLIEKYKKLYLCILNPLLGDHFDQLHQKDSQLLGYVFANDLSAQRCRPKKGTGSENHPYVRSVMVVPPKYVEKMRKFIELLNTPEGQGRVISDLGPPFQSVEASIIVFFDIDSVISYGTKLLGTLTPSKHLECWTIFPSALSERQAYPQGQAWKFKRPLLEYTDDLD